MLYCIFVSFRDEKNYRLKIKPAGDTKTIIVLKSKGLSDQIIKPPNAPDNILGLW